MKNFIILAISSSLLSCGSKGSVVGERTSIEVKTEFDAGNILKGEIIKAKFKVTNSGNTPLIIAEVTGSCTCTVSDFEKEPIAPGNETYISVEVATDKAQYGDLAKTATIIANTQPSATPLLIKANLTSK